ncbi:MAG: hypothetical protein ACTJFX_06605, partial [Pseudoalteromonas prydzensis]
ESDTPVQQATVASTDAQSVSDAQQQATSIDQEPQSSGSAANAEVAKTNESTAISTASVESAQQEANINPTSYAGELPMQEMSRFESAQSPPASEVVGQASASESAKMIANDIINSGSVQSPMELSQFQVNDLRDIADELDAKHMNLQADQIRTAIGDQVG